MVNLSIIIPVYKVEQYIDQCLSSIFVQCVDDSRIEVIVVNDGTPDRSMDIVDRYAELHSNLHIINQANAGLSMARNAGLAIAKGKYIWFVDSDDWVTSDAISRILAIIEGNSADIFAMRLVEHFEATGETTIEPLQYEAKNILTPAKEYIFRGMKNSPAQRFIFRREHLASNNLKFKRGLLHEDLEFCPRALYLAESVEFIAEPTYEYRWRAQGSITASFKKRNFDSLNLIYNVLNDFGREQVSYADKRDWQAYLGRHLFYTYYKLVKTLQACPESEDIKKAYKETIPTIRKGIRAMLKSRNVKKHQIKDVYLISLFPRLALPYYLKHWK